MPNAETKQLHLPLTVSSHKDAATHMDGGRQALCTLWNTKPYPCIFTSGFQSPCYSIHASKPRIAIIKILTFHTDYISSNSLNTKEPNQPNSNSPSKCRIFENIALLKKSKKKQLMSYKYLSLLVRHLHCCRLSSAYTLTPFLRTTMVQTQLWVRAFWSFAVASCW